MLFDKGLCHYVRGTDIYDGIVEIDLFHSVDPQKHSKFVCEGDIVTGRVGTIGNLELFQKNLIILCAQIMFFVFICQMTTYQTCTHYILTLQ